MGNFLSKKINYTISFKDKFKIVKNSLDHSKTSFFERIKFPLEEALHIYNFDIIKTIETYNDSDTISMKCIYNNIESKFLIFDFNYIRFTEG